MDVDNDTYEIVLSNGKSLNVTGDSFRALEAATFTSGQHSRYVKVHHRVSGHGSPAGNEAIVNCDHVVTASRLG